MRIFVAFLAFLTMAAGPAAPAAEYDLVVYGGTSAGVAAAVQAARMGKSAVLIEPGRHVGGLTSGGLGFTDSGNKSVIGGLAREFYRRVKKHYDQPSAWTYEKPEQYPYYRPKEDAQWNFEPRVAEAILRALLAEHKVPVVFGERLDRSPGRGVAKDGRRLTAIVMESGRRFAGKMFIDATYEGDLMAVGGVSFTVGREPNAQYGESLNGVQKAKNTHNHRFVVKVDPFVKPGDPKSGLLFGIEPGPYPPDGAGDRRVQAYCYRLCMSNVRQNRVPFPKPADYDEARFELLLRNFEAGDLRLPLKIDRMPNGKTDTNNNCAVSIDYIGGSNRYPEASYPEREKILREHESYEKGLLWTLANHPRVPRKIRDQMSPWGLAKDEFTDTGHWPHQIYVREARRMVGAYVVTELDCRRRRPTPDSAGMGSYNMDSHNCMRYVAPDGGVQNEGDIQVSPGGAYQISYRALVPKPGECGNLLVPVCLSSSHIAYGSIRMEPVFFILGQSAATAAVLALSDGVDVQQVDYPKLRARLEKDGQVLEWTAPARRGALNTPKRARRPNRP
jgi:FAD-dependent oxidoreductase family protein